MLVVVAVLVYLCIRVYWGKICGGGGGVCVLLYVFEEDMRWWSGRGDGTRHATLDCRGGSVMVYVPMHTHPTEDPVNRQMLDKLTKEKSELTERLERVERDAAKVRELEREAHVMTGRVREAEGCVNWHLSSFLSCFFFLLLSSSFFLFIL